VAWCNDVIKSGVSDSLDVLRVVSNHDTDCVALTVAQFRQSKFILNVEFSVLFFMRQACFSLLTDSDFGNEHRTLKVVSMARNLLVACMWRTATIHPMRAEYHLAGVDAVRKRGSVERRDICCIA
jgi:hypothetical protein